MDTDFSVQAIGKEIVEVHFYKDRNRLTLFFSDGWALSLYETPLGQRIHWNCEDDLQDLAGARLVQISHRRGESKDGRNWAFLRIDTDKGPIVINCYFSEEETYSGFDPEIEEGWRTKHDTIQVLRSYASDGTCIEQKPKGGTT